MFFSSYSSHVKSFLLALKAAKQTFGTGTAISKFVHILKHEGIDGITNRLKRLDKNNYSKWLQLYGSVSNADVEKMNIRQTQFKLLPLISVIMPVYDPRPEWLEKAIESVIDQIYPNWELCIADDFSQNPEIRKILNRYLNLDPRIKVVFRKTNGHMAECSNSALELASGEFIAMLDHDDLLTRDALFCVAEAINQNPSIRIIFSDEDKITPSGHQSDPYFKCDWNRDLFYSHNMISHLGIYQTELVIQAGKFRVGYEGSQDYDLALRCLELVKDEQVYHIPRVLYHWRIHKNSTARSANSKPYAMVAGEKALNEHFQRTGTRAEAQLIGYGYRVRYALPEVLPLVSIIIPTRNKPDLLKNCLESIETKTTYPHYEIIIVDNGSDDSATLHFLDQLACRNQAVRVLKIDAPFNYSSLNNHAVETANGEYIALLNNDVTVISPEWLNEMVSLAIQPGIGVVGAKLYYPDDAIQHAGIILGLGADGTAGCAHNKIHRKNKGYFGRASLINSFSAVTAACMVMRKDLYVRLGGFNETDLPVSYNDVDFCLRAKKSGYRIVFTPYAELQHHESASRGLNITSADRLRTVDELNYFKNHWSQEILNDPAYSPNLSLNYSDFSLAWPPRTKNIVNDAR